MELVVPSMDEQQQSAKSGTLTIETHGWMICMKRIISYIKAIDPMYAFGAVLLAIVLIEATWFPGMIRNAIGRHAVNVTLPEIQIPNRYEVVEIPDGDSIVIKYYGKYESIQLRNVVTTVRGKPGFTEAQSELRSLIGDSRVQLEFEHGEIERDFFSRFIPHVYVDGLHLNHEMIRLGHSAYEAEPDDSRYRDEFIAAEEEAHTAKRGIWADAAIPSASDTSQ